MNDAEKKAKRKYREKMKQISITVTNELYKAFIENAAKTGKSKAQYLKDLIIADTKKRTDQA